MPSKENLMKAASKILQIIEDESRKLRIRVNKGEELKFDDVKILLKALGLFAGDPEIQAAARKKNLIWAIALASFAGAMKVV